MIESCEFVNVVDGYTLAFNDNHIPFKEFNTDVVLRTDETDKMQKDGIWPGFTYLGKRVFRASGDILGTDSTDYWQRRLSIMRALRPSPNLDNKICGTLFIEFTGIGERLWSECSLEGYPEIPMAALSPSRGDYMIAWKSFDPRLYGETDNSETVDFVAVSTTGREYNKTYKKFYAGSAAGLTDVVAQNLGNTDTYLRAIIYGPCYSPTIAIIYPDLTQDVWQLSGYTVAVGETVTVDFAAHTAFSSNGQNVYDFTRGSVWFQLQPGSNTLRVQSASASSPSHVDLMWYNAYLI